MSKEQLLAYIQLKGNNRKSAMHDACVFQTNDWHRTQEVSQNIGARIEALQESRQQFQDNVASQAKGLAEEKDHIRGLEVKLNAKKAELLKEKDQSGSSDTFKSQMRAAEMIVTKEMIAQINKILENDSPAPLTQSLEHFISLLRDKPNTKSVDVELFLQDHGKLVATMKKADTTKCRTVKIEQVLAQLEALQNQFGPATEGAVDVTKYRCFLDWSINYCKAAKIDLNVYRLQEEVAKISLELERASLAVSRFDQIERQNNEFQFAGFYNKAIAQVKARAEIITQIESVDLDQAREYQKKYKGFENDYFRSYLSMVQDQANQ